MTNEREQASGVFNQRPYKGEIQVYAVQPDHHLDRNFCVVCTRIIPNGRVIDHDLGGFNRELTARAYAAYFRGSWRLMYALHASSPRRRRVVRATAYAVMLATAALVAWALT